MRPASIPEGGARSVRVAVFGSFYRGYFVLERLLRGRLAEQLAVVGVATDDPQQPFVSAHKRVWQYPHTPAEERMVADLARQHHIPVYTDRVKTTGFYKLMETEWRPDVCLMATFGQRVDERLFTLPRLGFFNLHPCLDDAWPSRYVGGNPFELLLREGQPYTRIAMHHVDAGFDTGALVAYSAKVAVPPQASVTDMHKLTACAAADLAEAELSRLLEETQ